MHGTIAFALAQNNSNNIHTYIEYNLSLPSNKYTTTKPSMCLPTITLGINSKQADAPATFFTRFHPLAVTPGVIFRHSLTPCHQPNQPASCSCRGKLPTVSTCSQRPTDSKPGPASVALSLAGYLMFIACLSCRSCILGVGFINHLKQ
jgi:hypothetical protein